MLIPPVDSSYSSQNTTHKDHAAVAYCVVSPLVIILTLEHWVETKINLLPNTSVEPLHLVVACVKHTLLKRSDTGHRKGIRLNGRSHSRGTIHSCIHPQCAVTSATVNLVSPAFEEIDNLEAVLCVQSTSDHPFLVCPKHYQELYR